MTQTILVTGGAGYVGSHTVLELLAHGHRVVVFDNLSQGHREAVPPQALNVVGDLADKLAVARLFLQHRFDAVLHFAANSLVGESMQKPLRYVGDNVVNAMNLIEAAVDQGVKKFVLSSTCAIFGYPERVPIAENAPTAPVNPYGESKLMIEKALAWADRAHGLKYACLRYFNAAGAHESGTIGEDHSPETHLIPIAFEAALGLRAHVEIFGSDYQTQDGTCIRDYIHVSDLADAHVRVLDALAEKSRHYNVGIGRGYSVRAVLESVRRVTGKPLQTRIGTRRPGDPPVLVADSSLIRRELGWTPRYTVLDDIVASAWAWRRQHPHGFSAALAAE